MSGKKRKAERKKRQRKIQRRRRMFLALFLLVMIGFIGICVLDAVYRKPQEVIEPTATPIPTELPTQEPTVAPTLNITPEPTIESTPQPLPTPEPTPEKLHIKITAAGDCTLGGNVPNGGDANFASYFEAYGADYFFENVRELFENDDFTIVNLEGPLTTSNSMRPDREFNFRGKPEYVQILTGSSVEACNVANNHAKDFGEQGLSDTAELLEANGIGACGYGYKYTVEIKGKTITALGFTEWSDSDSEMKKTVSSAKESSDLVIVSIHWGEERVYKTLSNQRRLGRLLVDAGADLVLGTHSHVCGGIELYNGKYIVYSLGNFCFGGNRNPSDKNCILFQQTFGFDSEGNAVDNGISVIPARISGQDNTNDFQPYILEADAGAEILKKVGELSTELDFGTIKWAKDSYEAENFLQ